MALRNKKGEYVLLNGNQTLVLLMSYQLTRWAERGELDGNQYVVKTIVTSQMANAVAEHFKVKCYDCLTGFKYIAKIIRENEGKAKYIGGGEESFGYLAGDYVRDKDAVSACSLAAEAAAWAMDTMGLTLYEWLQELYVKYGFYREGLVSVVRKGKEGAELIQKMMVDFRADPPKAILGSPVVKINDFQTLETLNVETGAKTPIEQDRSNVLQWFTADGTTVSVRPSGTEPKIKFYFGVKAPLASVAGFDKTLAELDAKIEGHQARPQAGVVPCFRGGSVRPADTSERSRSEVFLFRVVRAASKRSASAAGRMGTLVLASCNARQSGSADTPLPYSCGGDFRFLSKITNYLVV